MSSPFPTPLKAMLFDLDGTLVDTAADFTAVLNDMTRAAGIAPTPYEAIHQTVSNGARALVKLAFDLNPEDPLFQSHLDTLLGLYRQRIESTQATLYPGMESLLAQMELSGIKWGIVTNKPQLYSRPLLSQLQLLERCATLICPDDVTQTKPHPEPLFLACTQMGLSPETVVYVGDHPRDIEAGNAAGMFTIAVTYGYLPSTPPVDSWGADLIVDRVEEIQQCLA